MISSVARTVAANLRRSTDFFARYGGEEFVAFMVGDPSDKAFLHMKHIRQVVEDLHIPHNPEVSKCRWRPAAQPPASSSLLFSAPQSNTSRRRTLVRPGGGADFGGQYKLSVPERVGF